MPLLIVQIDCIVPCSGDTHSALRVDSEVH